MIKYNGARIGGPQRKAKALWINEEEYIYELPHCDLLYRNRRGEFVCGKPLKDDDSDQGEWGMCVLEGYSSPENCIISRFFDEYNHTSTINNVDGFNIVQPIKCCYS